MSNNPQNAVTTTGLAGGTATAVNTLKAAIATIPVSEGNAAAIALCEVVEKLRAHGA